MPVAIRIRIWSRGIPWASRVARIGRKRTVLGTGRVTSLITTQAALPSACELRQGLGTDRFHKGSSSDLAGGVGEGLGLRGLEHPKNPASRVLDGKTGVAVFQRHEHEEFLLFDVRGSSSTDNGPRTRDQGPITLATSSPGSVSPSGPAPS